MKDILTRYDVHSLPHKIFYMGEFIHDDESIIHIKLRSSNDSSPMYTIQLKEALAYRYICDEESAMPRKTVDTWPLYAVEKSSYLEWFHSVSYGIRKHNKIKHFSIITSNGVMDILSLDAPEVLHEKN